MLPSSTAKVPVYKPHSNAAEVVLMMKATNQERAVVRLTAAWKA